MRPRLLVAQRARARRRFRDVVTRAIARHDREHAAHLASLRPIGPSRRRGSKGTPFAL